jgi:RNA polymerase sigma-70 factor (ECF subfamily)
MADIPSTRLSLLARLRDVQDHAAWSDFVRLYAPAVYRFARRQGLQDADAADLTQEVLRSVAGSIGRLDLDPCRGRFRSWLFTLAHRRLCDLQLQQRRQTQGSGDTGVAQALLEQPDRAEEQRWNEDLEREIFRCAADKVRPDFGETTWQAFWRTAVEGQSGREAAAALGLSVAAVYLARGRVMVRLKEQIARMMAEDDELPPSSGDPVSSPCEGG